MARQRLDLLGLGARALTVLRLVAIVPFAWLLMRAIETPSPALASGLAVLYVAVAFSDFADGRLARAAGTASASWGRVDVAADVLFNATSLAVAACFALVGPWLPAAVAVLGVRYLWRGLRAEATLLPTDPLGRIAGVLFYAMVGLVVAEVVWGVLGRTALARLGDATSLYALVVFVRGLPRRPRGLPLT